jgi:hypothetical protein
MRAGTGISICAAISAQICAKVGELAGQGRGVGA